MAKKRRSSSSNEIESKKMRKKKKNRRVEKEVGINSLPDSILHHILSFLTMKQAIQTTSLVSKRWRYLWASIPTLNFTRVGKENEKEKEQAFMEFVDTVLILRNNSYNIQRFSITDEKDDSSSSSSESSNSNDTDDEFSEEFSNDSYVFHRTKKPISRLNIWIRGAILRNLEEIHLEICFGESVELPHCLFTCNSLRKLKLISLYWKPTELILPDSFSLPQLQILHLDGLTLRHEDDFKINHFLSSNISCPALESLTLNKCGIQAKNLNIVAYNLKHLVINENSSKKHFMKHGGATGSVRLYAPKLISFHCRDYLSKTYCLENLSCLVEAYIDMKVQAQEKLKKRILKKGRQVMICEEKMINFGILHNVKHLQISAWALQIFISTYGSSDSASTEFPNLKCLKLQTWLSEDCIRGITWLLNISPNIVKLSLEVIADTFAPVFPQWDEIKLNTADIGDFLILPLHCMLDQLKIVEIRGLMGTVNELKFLEVLLKNAVVLKELIVGFSPDYLEGKCFRKSQLIKYCKNLQSLPRASSSVSILLIS